MTFVPFGLNRSQVACWMSIRNLVLAHPGDSWLWTFTFADVLPLNYAANVHHNLTREIERQERAGRWQKQWGAVKVPEVHPGGHGLHFHWVAYPRLDIHQLLKIAHGVGFGRIHVHTEPCTERVATYLAKYLTKGQDVPGVRWRCIGHYDGVRVQDVEISSNSIDAFRQAYREAIAAGKPRGAAWGYAKLVQRRFDHSHEDPRAEVALRMRNNAPLVVSQPVADRQNRALTDVVI